MPDELRTLREREVGSIRLTEMLSVLFVTAVIASTRHDIEQTCARNQIAAEASAKAART